MNRSQFLVLYLLVVGSMAGCWLWESTGNSSELPPLEPRVGINQNTPQLSEVADKA